MPKRSKRKPKAVKDPLWSRLLAAPCPSCGDGCDCGNERFLYRPKDGTSVFTGIVVRPPGEAGTGMFKLTNPYDSKSASYELSENEVMAHFTQYDDCAWPSAPDRRADLIHRDQVELVVDEAYDELRPCQDRIRVGDSVKICTNFPHHTIGFVRERFWARVLAVHTFGTMTTPTLTVLPLIDRFHFISQSDWDTDVPMLCDLSAVLFSKHRAK
tara:strand:+ start:189 stop:827 length:639 start_codon:yes stop_codon:yes gene_type:complete